VVDLWFLGNFFQVWGWSCSFGGSFGRVLGSPLCFSWVPVGRHGEKV